MTASGADTYTYDANGNQTTRMAGGVMTTYAYDKLDRLTGLSGPTTASYTYNGDGLRVGKTVGGVTTRYAWDPTGLGVVLSDGAEYVGGAGLISQSTASGTQTYAQADGLGSIRLLTDATGAVVGSQQYDAFGGSRAQSGAQLPFGFTGEQTDAESGLVYLRARYYDPGSGRFLSADPLPGSLSTPASQHGYAYGLSNPLRWTDPTGEAACEVVGADCGDLARGAAAAAGAIVAVTGLPAEVVVGGGIILGVGGYEIATHAGDIASAGKKALEGIGDRVLSKKGGQGKKERERSIKSLEEEIKEHEQKIRDNPNSPTRKHWEDEIEEFKRQVEKHRKKIGGNKGQRSIRMFNVPEEICDG